MKMQSQIPLKVGIAGVGPRTLHLKKQSGEFDAFWLKLKYA